MQTEGEVAGACAAAAAAQRLGIDQIWRGQRIWVGGQWFYVAGILNPAILAPAIDSSVLVGYPAAEHYLGFDGHPSTVYLRVTNSQVTTVDGLLAAQANRETPARSTSPSPRPPSPPKPTPRARSTGSSSASARSPCWSVRSGWPTLWSSPSSNAAPRSGCAGHWAPPGVTSASSSCPRPSCSPPGYHPPKRSEPRERARALLVRRLITGIVARRKRDGLPDASFNSTMEEAFRAGQAAGLYEDPAGTDARARALQVCDQDLLGEIASNERRPPTLERLGLLAVGYPGIEQLARDDLAAVMGVLSPDEDAVRWLSALPAPWPAPRRGVGHGLLCARLEPKTEAGLADAGATVRTRQPVSGLGDTTVKPAGTSIISICFRGSVAAMIRKAFPAVTGHLEDFLTSTRATLDLGSRIVLRSGEGEADGFDWPRIDPDSDQALYRLAVLYEEVPGGVGYLR